MKKLVIAGSYEQAQLWIKNDLAKRNAAGEPISTMPKSDYMVVHNPDQIKGLRDPHGVFVGTWKNRADINDIVDALYARTMGKNHALDKVYHDLTREDFIGNTPDQVIMDELSKILKRDIDASVLERIGIT